MSTTLIEANATVRLDWVQVVDRHRSDLGDVAALARSIQEVGLLHPLTVTRAGRLIAGQRRLEACRLLGWDRLPVRYADNLDDATRQLCAERDENTCRLDMRPSELAALGAALRQLHASEAKQRQGTRTDLGAHPGELSGKFGQDTRDAVGEALGMTGRTYQWLHNAHTLANDPDAPADERALAKETLNEMDATGSIWQAGKKLKARIESGRAAKRHEERKNLDGDWIPEPTDRGRAAIDRRRELIRELAPRGYTSRQIGELLGRGAESVRDVAKTLGVEIAGDKTMLRTQSRIDSNRVVRETVRMLADAESALDLVDFTGLDLSQVPEWTSSLSKSIRRLNRLNTQLKELVQ